MTSPAIRVQGLGKRYPLGAQAQARSVREAVSLLATAPLRRLGLMADRAVTTIPADGVPEGMDADHIWALRDLDFEIQAGEVVAFIGRNGSGKSTLLKILSRITEPTEGRVEIRGRVGSLLEVGTGFHPELTGRENVFLSGAVMGMARREIAQRFDEIVAFSGVERFIETPVKFYSSGMYLRLAFAVAAHLQSDILIVDEVLAVGDADFQKKSLNKIREVAADGRTVLFVSHDLSTVSNLCQRAFLLQQGELIGSGPTGDLVTQYLNMGRETTSVRVWDEGDAPGDERAVLRAVRVVDSEGRPAERHDIRQRIGIQMDFAVQEPGHVLVTNHHVTNGRGILVFLTAETHTRWGEEAREPGEYRSTVWIPPNFLAEGVHHIGSALTALQPISIVHFEESCVDFEVYDLHEPGSVRCGHAGDIPGVVRPMLDWDTERL